MFQPSKSTSTSETNNELPHPKKGRGSHGFHFRTRWAAQRIRSLSVFLLLHFLLKYFVHRTVTDRHDVDVSVWTASHVGNDTEVCSRKKRFTFRDIELSDIVSDPVLQARIIKRYLIAVSRKPETEEVTSLQRVPCCTHNEISFELRAQCAALNKPDTSGRDFKFPTEFRVYEFGAGQHEQS